MIIQKMFYPNFLDIFNLKKWQQHLQFQFVIFYAEITNIQNIQENVSSSSYPMRQYKTIISQFYPIKMRWPI